jgi:hypothetical protein
VNAILAAFAGLFAAGALCAEPIVRPGQTVVYFTAAHNTGISISSSRQSPLQAEFWLQGRCLYFALDRCPHTLSFRYGTI